MDRDLLAQSLRAMMRERNTTPRCDASYDAQWVWDDYCQRHWEAYGAPFYPDVDPPTGAAAADRSSAATSIQMPDDFGIEHIRVLTTVDHGEPGTTERLQAPPMMNDDCRDAPRLPHPSKPDERDATALPSASMMEQLPPLPLLPVIPALWHLYGRGPVHESCTVSVAHVPIPDDLPANVLPLRRRRLEGS
jgi:hypothetical protein